jgi:CRP-like cAMP-binding protein
MSPAKLSLLSSLFKYKTLESGSTLFEEGSQAGAEGNSLFFLYEGSVQVVVNDPHVPSGRKVLKELGKDRFFGEVSHSPIYLSIYLST